MESTVVTAYFRVSSKHSHQQYTTWMANVLATGSPMVIYSDEMSHSTVLRLRPPHLPTKHVVLSLQDFAWAREYRRQPGFWERQRQLDPEREGPHRDVSPELYQIWNSKLEMVQRAADRDWFGSTHFWWVDVGSLREGTARFTDPWPGPAFPAATVGDKVVVANPWEDVVQGGFFGGSRAAIRWYHDQFYAEMARRAQAGMFVGKDQPIMTSL